MGDTRKFSAEKPQGQHGLDLHTAISVLSLYTPWVARVIRQIPVVDVSGLGMNGIDDAGRVYIDFDLIKTRSEMDKPEDPDYYNANVAIVLLTAGWATLQKYGVRGESYQQTSAGEWNYAFAGLSLKHMYSALTNNGAPSDALSGRSLTGNSTLTEIYSRFGIRSALPDTVDEVVNALTDVTTQAELEGKKTPFINGLSVASLNHEAGTLNIVTAAQGGFQVVADTSGNVTVISTATGQPLEVQGAEYSDLTPPIVRILPGTIGDNASGFGNGQSEQGQQTNQGSSLGGDDSEGSDGQGEGPDSDAGAPGFDGTSAGAPSLTDEDLDTMQMELAKDIQEQNGSKSIGNSSSDFLTKWAADRLVPPVLTERELFRRKVRGRIDYHSRGKRATNTRRNRRQPVGTRVIIPAYVGVRPKMHIAIDVSGSMSDDDLLRAFSEVTELARDVDVYYYSVSTNSHEIHELKKGQTPQFDRDYGGTDMRVAFAMFETYAADFGLVITDGYTPWPTENELSPRRDYAVAIVASDEMEYMRIREDIPKSVATFYLPRPGSEDWGHGQGTYRPPSR